MFVVYSRLIKDNEREKPVGDDQHETEFAIVVKKTYRCTVVVFRWPELSPVRRTSYPMPMIIL